jgi:cytochrome oxidase assembly protein ShyY1
MRLIKLGWIPALAALGGVVLTMALGNWQVRRGEQKEAIQATMALAATAAPVVLAGSDASAAWSQPQTLVNRRLAVRGIWLPADVVYLDNRPYQGQAGYYVLMPLQLAESSAILIVNRGWLPRDARDRTRIAPYATPAGLVDVAGIALAEEPRLFDLGSAPAGKRGGIWQNFDFDAFKVASSFTPIALVLRQEATPATPTSQDGLVRDWPDRGASIQAQIDRHHGYAFQWYGLSALIVFLTLFYGYRNARKSTNTKSPG